MKTAKVVTLKKAKWLGSDEWRKGVRFVFENLSAAAKEGSLVLFETVADDDTKEGLKVAVIARKLDVDSVGGRLLPLAIIIDEAMWPLIEEPKGEYEILHQDGEITLVEQTDSK